MQISVTHDTFKLAQVFTISRGSRTEAKVLTVRVNEGSVTGWGECVPYARYGETPASVAGENQAPPGDLTREGLYHLPASPAAFNAVASSLWAPESERVGLRACELPVRSAPGP